MMINPKEILDYVCECNGIYDFKYNFNNTKFDVWFTNAFDKVYSDDAFEELLDNGSSDEEIIIKILEQDPNNNYHIEYIDESKHNEHFVIYKINYNKFYKFIQENLDSKYLSDDFHNMVIARKI